MLQVHVVHREDRGDTADAPYLPYWCPTRVGRGFEAELMLKTTRCPTALPIWGI